MIVLATTRSPGSGRDRSRLTIAFASDSAGVFAETPPLAIMGRAAPRQPRSPESVTAAQHLRRVNLIERERDRSGNEEQAGDWPLRGALGGALAASPRRGSRSRSRSRDARVRSTPGRSSSEPGGHREAGSFAYQIAPRTRSTRKTWPVGAGISRALCRTRTDDPFLTMEARPGKNRRICRHFTTSIPGKICCKLRCPGGGVFHWCSTPSGRGCRRWRAEMSPRPGEKCRFTSVPLECRH